MSDFDGKPAKGSHYMYEQTTRIVLTTRGFKNSIPISTRTWKKVRTVKHMDKVSYVGQSDRIIESSHTSGSPHTCVCDAFLHVLILMLLNKTLVLLQIDPTLRLSV